MIRNKILVLSNCDACEHLGSGYVIKKFLAVLSNKYEIELYSPKDFKPILLLKNRALFYQTSYRMFLKAKERIKKNNYSAILFFGGEAWLAAIYTNKFRPNIKRLHHSNGIEPVYATASAQFHTSNKTGYKLIGLFSTWAFKNMDGIVLHNENDKYWVQKNLKIAEHKILYIPIPLPDDMLGLNNPPISERPFTIGFCGSWILRKGVDVVAETINTILTDFPKWNFIIIGQPDDFDATKYFSNKVIERIKVLPVIISKTEMIGCLQQIRIMFLPSRLESFGLVFTEALAGGAVLVANKTGYTYSLKKGEAIITDDNSASNYISQLDILMNNERQCAEIAARGYKVVQQLSWNSVGADYLNFFKTILN